MRILIVLLILAANSCGKTDSSIHFSGKLEKQGFTTYQYGTHTITDGKKTYALRSAAVNLDKYASQEVTITATKIEGSPIEGGPEFLEVQSVEVR